MGDYMINKLVRNRIPIQMKASFWFLISAFLQRGIILITTPIFTRLLNTNEYGQFSVFNSWLRILTIFITLNLFAGVYTQGLIKFEKIQKQFSSSLQGLTFTLVVIWTIIYLLFSEFWNGIFSLTTVQMLAMIVCIWTSAIFSFWSTEKRVEVRYKALVFFTIIASIAKPLVGIFFVIYAEDKVTARILSITLVQLVVYTGFFFVQLKKGKQFYSREIWKYVLTFNIPLLPHYLSMSVLNSADRIMIRNMVNESAAGIYSLAYSVSLIMSIFSQAILQTVEPWLYRKINSRQIHDIARITYSSFIIIACVNIVLIAFAPEIIAIFAPAEYYEAIWIVPPVTMSVYFIFSYTFFGVFEFYFEKRKYITIATFSGAILNVILNYLLIDTFGYMVAGYTTLFCYIIFSVFHLYFSKKLCREYLNNMQPYETRIIFFITVIFLTIGFVYLMLYDNTFLRYIFSSLLLLMLFIKRKVVISSIYRLAKIKRNKES